MSKSLFGVFYLVIDNEVSVNERKSDIFDCNNFFTATSALNKKKLSRRDRQPKYTTHDLHCIFH